MPTTSIDPNNIIQDPSISLAQPSPAEAVLFAQLGKNSLAAPFAAGLELRRGAENMRQQKSTGANNALRTRMAQQIARAEFDQARFNTVASNVGPLGEAGGRDFAVGLLGEEPTGFSLDATALDLAGLQAGTAETAADAALAGARAGLRPRSSPEFEGLTGFEVEEVTPLGVQEAGVTSRQPTLQIYDPATDGFFKIPISIEDLPAHIRSKIDTAAAGTATGDTVVPADSAQATAVDTIKRRVARDGGEHLGSPRQMSFSDGTKAIEYHVRLADGSEFYYYAFEGDPQVRGSDTPVGAE